MYVGMVWYGMVWYGMVWYGILCCSKARTCEKSSACCISTAAVDILRFEAHDKKKALTCSSAAILLERTGGGVQVT